MVDRDVVRRGYDEIAETYAAERSEGGREVEILARFLARVEIPARILDVGCGQGTPILRELSASATAVGIDISREQLGLAAERVPDASCVQGDMTALPIGDDTCDAVTAIHSLIHVPIDDHQAVVDEFARVLRPGGRLLLSEGSEEWSGENPDWLDSGVEMQWDMAGPDATREQLRNAGFAITDEWGATGRFADEEERWGFFSARLDA